LHESQVALPAHCIALDRRIVVAIHKDVDDDIEGAQEEEVAPIALEADYQVSDGGHQNVVEHVQERYLHVLLAQHTEHGVQQVHNLVNVVSIANGALPILHGMILGQDGHASKVVRLED